MATLMSQYDYADVENGFQHLRKSVKENWKDEWKGYGDIFIRDEPLVPAQGALERHPNDKLLFLSELPTTPLLLPPASTTDIPTSDNVPRKRRSHSIDAAGLSPSSCPPPAKKKASKGGSAPNGEHSDTTQPQLRRSARFMNAVGKEPGM